MTDHIIKVPYYSQHDVDSGLNSYWQNRSCGIIAIKMVIDYFQPRPTDLAEMFEYATNHGGTHVNGDWLHSTLVNTARHYGYLSWRRSWIPSRRDKEFFLSEQVDEASIQAWEEQTKSEAVPSLLWSLAQNFPVVVSVAKNFDETSSNHDVVLTGVRKKGDKVEGFYFNDPYTAYGGGENENRYVPVDQFNNNWTHRAIFVQPKESV